jgi:hypothetical protein
MPDMRRVTLSVAVLIALLVSAVGCRTSREDQKDGQRVEHHVRPGV